MKRPSSRLLPVVIMLFGLFAAGCGRGKVSHEWEIAINNRSSSAVDVAATYGMQRNGVQSQGNASLGNVASGKVVTLIVGPQPTVVKTVKVTRNGEAQELTPDAEISPGKKYLILVGTDGKVSGSVTDR